MTDAERFERINAVAKAALRSTMHETDGAMIIIGLTSALACAITASVKGDPVKAAILEGVARAHLADTIGTLLRAKDGEGRAEAAADFMRSLGVRDSREEK